MPLSAIKETLKKIPALRACVRGAKSFIKDGEAVFNFLSEHRVKRAPGPIRVAFICQYIPIWHKLERIYHIMKEDERFAPILICVPSNIKDGVLSEPDRMDNDTYDYFIQHGYTEALNALQPDGSWLDLEAQDLSYVFYPRPYDSFMPKAYWSSRVSQFTKICIILYGMNTTQEITKVTLGRDFFRYVYCYFAEMPYSQEQNTKNGWFAHKLGLQESVYYGMPGIESILDSEHAESRSWDFSKNDFRVIWTPRWTTDPALGGSNFFTYYRSLLEFAGNHGNMDFLFRPHPLALSHFLETGEMTQDEADSFRDQCAALPNVSLDTEKEYTATMWGSSVLISDISGLIPEFFVTGKPLIYCASNMLLTPERSTRQILECSYIVNNSAELFACLTQLSQGIDPLAEKREKLVAQLFPAELRCPARRIVEHLAK